MGGKFEGKVKITEELLFDEEFIAELKRRRETLGVSATRFARMLGLRPHWVLRVEQGKDYLARKPYYLVKRYLRALGFDE
ncbi:XRE family transcriptional regulator [Thermus scotoductus]|jgi:transcriptional regulator with XRE-family HTH domain|uniref:XRE family transcriptional regulator n=3 Tax=Thermus TaxID=270 RepID=A0A430SCD1_THESC|nr:MULTISPECIES: helix-turn-helix transcriptional regulator [Thermus]AEV16791.1 hypothetical protein TCCBUS3UF1_17520 [Thermus sp. CCB_US3_UF1]KOX91193.1 hypothetical protein BVI061214_00083 [Thermus aquaticus]MCS7219109.1 helix-turn-helix domain-containing protein [Thermus sp.]MCX7850557.1 helix-turn-helix domain-containing protein [Thermus sp.]MDW8017259.1 helix-turn-helix transcriptional regulator [Thermus sp.]